MAEVNDSTAGLTPKIRGLVETALEIESQDAKQAGMLGFMARMLVQATLPHSDPGTNYFERTNGLVTMSITSKPSIGVPYGSIPRILLSWIATEAVRTQSQELNLGKSQNEFLEKLNMHSNGRDISRLKNQTKRLLTSLISVTGERGDEFGVNNLLIADDAMLLWNPKKPDQQSLWDSTLTLTNKFFREITDRPVPVDLRVLHALSRSPMAMDIYTWLIYRLFILAVGARKEVLIPWHGLKAQFGAGYPDDAQGMRDFRKKFNTHLKTVLGFYPKVRVNPTPDGLELRESPPMIPAK